MTERLDALERLVDLQGLLIEQMAEQLTRLTARVLALRALLDERDILPADAVEARAQEMELDSTADVELDARFEEYREARERLRERGDDPS